MRAEGFSSSLDVLCGALWISELQFLIKKRDFFVSTIFFLIRIHLKCWIRIHNTAFYYLTDETNLLVRQQLCERLSFLNYEEKTLKKRIMKY
jgi:hypothetical protein